MPRNTASHVKPRKSSSNSTGTSKANPARKPRYRKHPPSPICTPVPQTISITAPPDAAPPGQHSADQPRPAAPNPPIRHGLARRNLVVCAEDAAFYQQFTASLTALFDPRDDNERFIVEQMVIHRWFILHADAAEAAAMRVAMQRAAQTTENGDPPQPARIYPSATSQPFPDPADPTDNTAQDSAALQMDLATAALCCDNNVQLITRYTHFPSVLFRLFPDLTRVEALFFISFCSHVFVKCNLTFTNILRIFI